LPIFNRFVAIGHGWFSLRGAALSWLTNPILLVAWVTFYKKMEISMMFAFFAMSVALSFLLFRGIVDNEAGHVNNIVSYGAGYFIWLSSSLIMLIGNLIVFFRKKYLP